MRTAAYYSQIEEAELKPIDYRRLWEVAKNVVGDILDIGCNCGELLKLIENNRLKVGIEVNKTRAKLAGAIIADAESPLPIKDNAFDTVCCLEVLEHLQSPERLLLEIARICRQRIIITVPFNEDIKPVRCVHCGQQTSVHLHSFTKDSLKSLISDKYTIQSISTINRMAEYVNTNKIIRPSRLPIWISFRKIVLVRPETKIWFLLIADKN